MCLLKGFHFGLRSVDIFKYSTRKINTKNSDTSLDIPGICFPGFSGHLFHMYPRALYRDLVSLYSVDASYVFHWPKL